MFIFIVPFTIDDHSLEGLPHIEIIFYEIDYIYGV